MDPKLLLVLKVLDLATLGYEGWVRSKPMMEELRAKIRHWHETQTEPTAEDFARVNERIDADIAYLQKRASET